MIELKDNQGRILADLCRSMEFPIQVYYGMGIMRIVPKGKLEDFQAIIELSQE
jgi:hypothetical protein